MAEVQRLNAATLAGLDEAYAAHTTTQGVLTEEECRQIVSILDQTAAREGHTGEGPEWNRDLSFFLGREGVLKQESAVMAKPRAIGTAHPNPAAL